MKKVLFAINNFSVGGAERMAVAQVRMLNREKFDVWMAALFPDPERNFSRDAEFLGDRLQRFRMRGLFDFGGWRAVYSFLKQEKFDAVVTSLFFANTVVRACALAARVPVIISHEQNVYPDKRFWQIVVDKILSFGTTRIVAVSKDVLEFTSAQEWIPREKFLVNYNSISAENFGTVPHDASELRKKIGLSADAAVVATAGRLIEQKGHVYVIRAAGELRALHPEAKFSLLIFGAGHLRDTLKREISKLGLEEVVHLPGIWPAADIMAIADIFVLPSLWEGLPLVLLEAMASAKPIVTTRVSGAWELINDGKSGFIVEPKDVSGLREKMFLLMFDADLRRRFGEAARKRSKEFSMERHVGILEALLS